MFSEILRFIINFSSNTILFSIGVIFGVLEFKETVFSNQISGFLSSSVAYLYPEIDTLPCAPGPTPI